MLIIVAIGERAATIAIGKQNTIKQGVFAPRVVSKVKERKA